MKKAKRINKKGLKKQLSKGKKLEATKPLDREVHTYPASYGVENSKYGDTESGLTRHKPMRKDPRWLTLIGRLGFLD